MKHAVLEYLRIKEHEKKTGGREEGLTSLEIKDGYPKGGNTLLWQSLSYPLSNGYSPYTLADTNYPHSPISSIACYKDF